MCSTSGEFDLDEVLWVAGVDYVGGWRDAVEACGELTAAISSAWPEVEGVTAVAQSAANGTGMVRLRIPAATARALAELIRAAAEGSNGRRAAS